MILKSHFFLEWRNRPALTGWRNATLPWG